MLIAAAAGIMLSAGLMPVAQADITASLQAGWDNPPDELTSGDELWVSYYSGHEGGNPSIYLAKIPMSVFRK